MDGQVPKPAAVLTHPELFCIWSLSHSSVSGILQSASARESFPQKCIVSPLQLLSNTHFGTVKANPL